MKRSSTIISSVVVLGFIALSQLGMKATTYPDNLNIQTASIFAHHSLTDTFDFNSEEFEKEMEKLKEELEVLKNREFQFDFDNEEFKIQMEKLNEELSELNLKDFNFEFDYSEFNKNMKGLKKELKDQKYSFHFDMDNFKEDMRELKEELKHLDIDLNSLDTEMEKLDGFMNTMREKLLSDGLIDNKENDFDLDLNKDEMIINGKPVPDELFKKYKDMYEEHFGKKLDGEHKLKIR